MSKAFDLELPGVGHIVDTPTFESSSGSRMAQPDLSYGDEELGTSSGACAKEAPI